MAWTVIFHPEFDAEFQEMEEGLQDELLAHAKLLQEFGPNLGRPAVDTLKGSRQANMKELRFAWKRRYGASRSPSIPGVKRYCLQGATRAARTRGGSTSTLSPPLIGDSTNTSLR